MADKNSKVLVAITALNEGKNLPQILEQLRGKYDVVVIDDGSTDDTGRISRAYGAVVLRHLWNLGQGCADITKFKYATKMGYDILVEMDGDGQHDPFEIFKFIEKLKNTDAEIIQGSRILGSNYKTAPFFRKTFLPYYTMLLNKLTGYNLTDCMCGFRAYNIKAIRNIQDVLDQILEPQYLAAEALIRFSKNGLNIAEVPISLKDRKTGKSYKGFLRYGLGILRAVIRTLVDKNLRKGTIMN